MEFKKSKELHEKALHVLVGGVNSPVRSFKRVGRHPVLASHAEGAYIWDVDGNSYIDLVMSYGPHLFGHAHKSIVEAVQKACEGSFCLGMTSPLEILWAEKVLRFFPCADLVRAVSSGTEACATAIRLARGVTGRSLALKFSGNYHGHVDSLLVSAGSGVATLSNEVVPDSAGIPKELIHLSRALEFNDCTKLQEFFDKEGKQVAAVILEPIVGNMGVIPPKKEFLTLCRKLCSEYGSLLIFDEVMTGLRVDPFSAQGLYGIEPDLTTAGKIIGGGLPLGALLGKEKFMKFLAPLGPVYQAGTLSGNPLSMAAGIAMLDLIEKEKPYLRLDEFGFILETIFYEAAKSHSHDIRIERVGSMMSLYFSKNNIVNASDVYKTDIEKFNRFYWLMVEEGFMLPPSPFEAWFLSTSHLEISDKVWKEKINAVFSKL